MSIHFSNTRIEHQTIIDGGPKEHTVSCRLTKAEKLAVQKAAAEDGLSESDFIRQGVRARLTFRGDRYYKLIYHAGVVGELIDGEAMPLVMR